MFKRNPNLAGSATAIRSSDRRKLIAQICASYKLLPPEEAKRVVPEGIRQQKFSTNAGVSGTIYSSPTDAVPLWIASENQIFPTVFALAWSEICFLPIIPLWDSPPEPFLAGAALFFGAVRFRESDRLAEIAKDTVVAYVAISREQGFVAQGRIIGVGQLGSQSIKEALLLYQAAQSTGGQAGRLCETISIVNDGLWSLISKEIAQYSATQLEKLIEYPAAGTTHPQSTLTPPTGRDEDTSSVPPGPADASQLSSATRSHETCLAADEIDQILHDALLQALPTIPLSTLPLAFSTFYSQYILPNRSAVFLSREAEVVIAKSNWKKLAKWLKAMDKSGLIKVKENRDGTGNVISLNLEHQAVRNHSSFTTISKVAAKQRSQDDQAEGISIQIEEYWLPQGAGLPFWSVLGYDKASRLTFSQISTELIRYARDRGLGADARNATDFRQIRLDDELCKAAIGKAEQPLPVWRKEKILDGLRSSMAPIHIINGVVGKGRLDPITWVVKKKAGKKVTEIQGVEAFLDTDQVANDLKIRFQGSSTVGPLIPGARSSKMLITIQGDQAKHLPEFFAAAGIGKRFLKP